MPHRLENHPALRGRHAGLLIPLFSMRSGSDWGIGDYDALAGWIGWLASTGTKILQMLPIHETGPGEDCPYAAITAFALDPVYIAVDSVPEVRASRKARAIIRKERPLIEKLRAGERVVYAPVRELKNSVLRAGFEYFYEREYKPGGARAAGFAEFVKNTGWLYNYSVFRALKDEYGWSTWTGWPRDLRDCRADAVARFRRRHEKEVLFYEYLQWIAAEQWARVRRAAQDGGVWLFGDLPFMVSQESADVWGNQPVFDIHTEVGAPPDYFNPEGQRWGLPAYNWHGLEATRFGWWRSRVRRATEIYDLFRLDHLVGFFRTWVIPSDGSGARFDNDGAESQRKRGERFLKMVIEEAGPALPVAEDLGVIPPFVYKTLSELDIPGYKILRWEKDEKTRTYRDPEKFPKISLSVASTHDTETLSDWWGRISAQERYLFWKMAARGEEASPEYDDRVHKVILERVLGAQSSIALLLLQDILAVKDRINTPGTVGERNWTCRTPGTPDETESAYGELVDLYRELVRRSGRAEPENAK
ncbi:MAG: 4-alpha-glucanotransferase [Elusimicrobiaceae bacterium]|nr:4-alpha-glucanotransferase [Elusimicrobiaceae bacterium]